MNVSELVDKYVLEQEIFMHQHREISRIHGREKPDVLSRIGSGIFELSASSKSCIIFQSSSSMLVLLELDTDSERTFVAVDS